MKRLIVPALVLALAACATAPTVYQPATGPRAVGYSEFRLEPGRYRVTFQGGPGAAPQYVSDLALLRAADLAIAEGYDWFQVTDRYTTGRPDRGPQIGIGVGGMSFGRHSSVGLGVGNSFSLGGGPSIATTLEVLMGRGPRPTGVDTYDPRALRQTLAPRV